MAADFQPQLLIMRLPCSNWQAQKVYQISVLNFEYDKDDKNALSWYTMQKDTGGKLGNRLNVILFDLIKIRRLRGMPPQKLTKLEKWGLYLALADDQGQQAYVRQITGGEKGIMAANCIVTRMSAEDAYWHRQNSYDIAMRDRNSERENAIRKGLEEGRARGLKEGLKQGIQQGLEEGITQGIAKGAHEKALATARNFLQMGLSIEQIAQGTELSQEEVRALQEP